MYSTTQAPGVVGQVPGNTIIGFDFEDRFGQWLSIALGLPRNAVRPGWTYARDKASDWEDCAFFFFGTTKGQGVRQRPQEDGSVEIDYFGQLDISVVIYGMNARYLSMLLVDTFSVGQNATELHKQCGLGFVDAEIQSQLLEPVGGDFRHRADVTLRFNYRYSRTWSVMSIAEAPDVTYSSEV